MSHADAYTGRSWRVRVVPWLCWLVVLTCLAWVFNTVSMNGLSDVAEDTSEEDAEADATTADGNHVRPRLLVGHRAAWQLRETNVGPSSIVAGASTSSDTVVMLSSVDEEGRRRNVVCLTSRDQVAADVLEITPEDMAAVVAHLCRGASTLLKEQAGVGGEELSR